MWFVAFDDRTQWNTSLEKLREQRLESLLIFDPESHGVCVRRKIAKLGGLASGVNKLCCDDTKGKVFASDTIMIERLRVGVKARSSWSGLLSSGSSIRRLLDRGESIAFIKFCQSGK